MSDYLTVVYDDKSVPYTKYPKQLCQYLFEKYEMKTGMLFLETGCGRGEFLENFKNLGMEVFGLDISTEAPILSKNLSICTANLEKEEIPFPDDHFDAVMAINVFHFLSPEKTEVAFKEMLRVGKGSKNYFVHVDAFTNEVERERLLAWAPIIKTVYSCDDWFNLFKKLGYEGDYYWTFVRPETPENFPAP